LGTQKIIILPFWVIVIFLSLSILIGLFLCTYFIIKLIRIKRLRCYPLFYSLLFCIFICLNWISCQLYEIFNGKQQSGFVFYMEYISVCFGAYSWLLFCLYYSKNKITKKFKSIFILILPPVFFYICIITNKYHQLFVYIENDIRRLGVLFYFHFLVFLIYSFIGCWILLKYAYQRKRQQKVLLLHLVLAYSIPITLTVINCYDIIRFDILNNGIYIKDFDMSSPCFFFLMMFKVILFIKYRMMNLTPMAYEEVFEGLKELVIIIDEKKKIRLVNKSFKKEFSSFFLKYKEINFDLFIEYLKIIVLNEKNKNNFIDALADEVFTTKSFEIRMENKKIYYVSIKPLIFSQEFLGKIVSFIDVTEYNSLIHKYNKKIKVLEKLNNKIHNVNINIEKSNKKLEEYSLSIKELAVAKERNRLAHDMHDTIGQSMSVLITLLEAGKLAFKKHPEKADKMFEKAIDTAKNCLIKVNSSINPDDSYSLQKYDFIKELNSIICELRDTGIKINFNLQEGLEPCKINNSYVIYRLCQEALTNSIRHGKATHIDIVFEKYNDFLKINIRDNGKGCETIKLGMGLAGMKNRIEKVNGKIMFTSSVNKYFEIIAKVPV